MVRYVLLLAGIFGLSGCAITPYPTSADKNRITVYQPYIGEFDREKAMHIAEDHCNGLGKKARLKADDGKKMLFVCY